MKLKNLNKADLNRVFIVLIVVCSFKWLEHHKTESTWSICLECITKIWSISELAYIRIQNMIVIQFPWSSGHKTNLFAGQILDGWKISEFVTKMKENTQRGWIRTLKVTYLWCHSLAILGLKLTNFLHDLDLLISFRRNLIHVRIVNNSCHVIKIVMTLQKQCQCVTWTAKDKKSQSP